MKIETPIGPLWLDADAEALTAISYHEIPESSDANKDLLKQAEAELTEFLQGNRHHFDVPYAFKRGTAFQQAVWQALAAIPYGETRSYQEIAIAIGRPKAVRAIGQANRNNPLPILIPCHRVIGKNGTLTGYAGSSETGLRTKEALLHIEHSA
ncbi:methylated-DNA--protein-cysteine methyltransferase [Enterococcus florum]|uniref:Methylated-DNA--protein-cysteine methyltransferase n=1 Tax=Enterococcus florum TaxID=2480627 RepID=A0A4P5P9M2_9ENTE|nr:methylated-DNA--[protein]-cysteine S-methyltransferase [Enterococcus florum]GCF94777.1 methylated-DNA--protein-cysteine methyltransferase [Enterococcus florum]